MRKRIAGAVAIACLTGAILVSCASNRYAEDGSPLPADTYGTTAYVTEIQIDGQSVKCVVLRESIDCDFAGDLEKRQAAQ